MVDSPSAQSLNPLISIQTLAISDVDWYTKRRYDAPHRYYSDGDDDDEDGGGDPGFLVQQEIDGLIIGGGGGAGAAPAPPPDPSSIAKPPFKDASKPSRSSVPRRPSASNSAATIPPSACAIKLNVAIKQPSHPNPPRTHRPNHTTAPAAATNRRKPRRDSLPEPTSPEITCLGKVRIRRRKGCPGQGLDPCRDMAGMDGFVNGKASMNPMMMRGGGRNHPAAVPADDRLSTKMDLCIVRGGFLRGNCTNQVADQHGLEANDNKKVVPSAQSSENRKETRTMVGGSRERSRKSGAVDVDKWMEGGNRGAPIVKGAIRDKMGDESDKIGGLSETIIKAMEARSERRQRRKAVVVSEDEDVEDGVWNGSGVQVMSVIDLSRFGSRAAGNGREVGLPETVVSRMMSGGSGRRGGGDGTAPPKNSLLLMRGRGSKAAAEFDAEAANEEQERTEFRNDYGRRLWERRNLPEPSSIGIITRR